MNLSICVYDQFCRSESNHFLWVEQVKYVSHSNENPTQMNIFSPPFYSLVFTSYVSHTSEWSIRTCMFYFKLLSMIPAN
jgi:hypothetical protein